MLDQAEERLSELKDRSYHVIESEEQKRKKIKEKWRNYKGFIGHHKIDQQCIMRFQ